MKEKLLGWLVSRGAALDEADRTVNWLQTYYTTYIVGALHHQIPVEVYAVEAPGATNRLRLVVRWPSDAPADGEQRHAYEQLLDGFLKRASDTTPPLPVIPNLEFVARHSAPVGARAIEDEFCMRPRCEFIGVLDLSERAREIEATLVRLRNEDRAVHNLW